MSEVLSVERVPFERLPDQLRARLSARMERLGYLGGFFQLAAHQPDALAAFIDFTEALKGALPVRLAELVALRTATLAGCEYERVQHERYALAAHALSLEEVRAVVMSDPRGSEGFGAVDIAVLELATCVAADHGHDSVAAFDRLVGLTDEPTAVGCLLLTARFLAHAAVANCWQLAAPRRSPLTEGA
jgi:alkylhydroperoxidase family enzyme